jgi:hypothetical protein
MLEFLPTRHAYVTRDLQKWILTLGECKMSNVHVLSSEQRLELFRDLENWDLGRFSNMLEIVEADFPLVLLELALKGEENCPIERVQTYLEQIDLAIERVTSGRKFVLIQPGREKLVANSSLFGVDVTKAFPSARTDIQEVGNCLAVDLNTAAVFHLMRVVECGLRALARHLKVKIKKVPLEYAEWGRIIQEIDAKVTKLRQGPRGPKKSAAVEF